MSWRSPMPIKFSNLLQTNPESSVYGIDMSTLSNIEGGNYLFEKLKRKSVNLGSVQTKRPIQSFSPQTENKNIYQIINRSKINRLLLQANFEQQLNFSKTKKKKVYVIRKKQQKLKTEPRERKLQSCQKSRILTQQNEQKNPSQASQPKKQQMFKIKRKIPKFGIEDITPKIAARKNSSYCPQTAGLFMSTSSNNFYNTSFYMNSKIRQAGDLRQQRRYLINQLTPEVTNLVPHPLNKQVLLEKKKQIQKFYTTNSNGFAFTRSKTEEIDPNFLCGWEKQQWEYNDTDGPH